MLDFEQIIQSLDWRQQPQGLYAPIEYTLAAGGKRLRPRLALLAARMYDGEEKAVPIALALEIFHNFTLLHDDLMDKAPTRRGRQTVYMHWNENTAILSGDQMLIEAYKQLEALPDKQLPHVLHLFSRMATEICAGQQLDMEFESRNHVSAEEYMDMIRLKTSVLLGAALEAGAYVAGAPEADRKLLREAGIQLGLAFQIQDDILDTFGDPATFGKPIGGDILNNKKTLLLISTLALANEEQLSALNGWLHAEKDTYSAEEKIAAIRHLYEQTGAKTLCEKRMQHCTKAALEALEQVSVDTAELRTLADQLLKRKK